MSEKIIFQMLQLLQQILTLLQLELQLGVLEYCSNKSFLIIFLYVVSGMWFSDMVSGFSEKTDLKLSLLKHLWKIKYLLLANK